jgi:hypothetical protein
MPSSDPLAAFAVAFQDDEVVKSLLSGDRLCNHENLIVGMMADGGYYAMCTTCLSKGPVGVAAPIAKELFWKQQATDRNRYLQILTTPKEPPMSSDYRRGVEDALTRAGELWDKNTYPISLETIISNTRSSLLTKKVTKWINMYSYPHLGNPQWGGSTYDTKEEAESYSGRNSFKYLGALPIEIEVSIE